MKSKRQNWIWSSLLCLLLLSACGERQPSAVETLPLAPTETAAPEPTATPEPTPTPTPTPEPWPSDGPAITEAMSYNQWYLPQNGEYYDWVEISNPTGEAIRLSDYYLSDKKGEPLRGQLPEQILEPGEYIVVFCDKDGGEGFMPFGLSASGETLYLSREDGTHCDTMKIPDLPYGMSYGRREGETGFFFFDQPSPGQANSGGAHALSQTPILLGKDGVFDGVDAVTVELSAPGVIRYTLDGSVPTEESPEYTGPIRVSETCALRAVSFEDGCLPSEVLTLSYILNEYHSLPVLSLVCEPDDMFGGYGIYTNPLQDWEVPASVILYDGDGGFRIDCGVKMHGMTSRFHMKKKSFKLNFRSRYDGALACDLFQNGVTEFSSLLLRSAQETPGTENWPSSYMRDTLAHQIAIRYFPELPAQDYKYTILYINGEYRGIYNIREAHSSAHYANHYGDDARAVSHWKVHWGQDCPFNSRYSLIDYKDLSDEEVYRQVTEYLDTDSVIAWFIVQAYSANYDYNSPNMRFYWSERDQKLVYALVDLDMSMMSYNSFPALFYNSYPYLRLGHALMQNAEFRDAFCRRLHDAVAGELADENIIAMIDELADQLRPEIARDRELWGGSAEEWEDKVTSLKDFVRYGDGRGMEILYSIQYGAGLTDAQMEEYFGDLLAAQKEVDDTK